MKNENHSHSLIQEVNTVSFLAFVKCVCSIVVRLLSCREQLNRACRWLVQPVSIFKRPRPTHNYLAIENESSSSSLQPLLHFLTDNGHQDSDIASVHFLVVIEKPLLFLYPSEEILRFSNQDLS